MSAMSVDWNRASVLTLTEFEVAWEQLGLDETPLPLDPPRAGRTPEERSAAVAAALDTMKHRGLSDGRRPRADLAGQLRLLARHRRALEVRYRHHTMVAGLAVTDGRLGVLGVRAGAEIAVVDVQPGRLAASVLDLVQEAPAGPGRTVSVATAALDGARRAAPADPDGFTAALVHAGVQRSDAVTLVDMCRGVLMRGQFGGASAPGDGARRFRAPHVIGFHRTAAGQYRQVRRGPTVTIGPAGNDALRAELASL